EPLNHANSVLIFLICRLAKEKVTVLLTGEGADEVFGGYPRLWLLALQQWFPEIVRKIMTLGLFALNGHYSDKLRTFLLMPSDKALLLNASFVLPESLKSLLKIPQPNFISPFRYSIIQSGAKNDRNLVQRGLYLDLHTYLVSILHRMDRMSMAAGIESRVPFLDHELVEFAAQIPYRLKLQFPDFQTKAILKRLALKRLPRVIVYRKKSGFGVPIAQWMRIDEGLGRYLQLLGTKQFVKRELFHKEVVESLVQGHRSGKEDNSELLWELINLEVWFQLFIDRISSENDAMELANDLLGTKPLS
ncbi:MAG: asparagine synthase C-terminal domain-containing protein, partial [Candidatus Bathyarchaeia archaeon]